MIIEHTLVILDKTFYIKVDAGDDLDQPIHRTLYYPVKDSVTQDNAWLAGGIVDWRGPLPLYSITRGCWQPLELRDGIGKTKPLIVEEPIKAPGRGGKTWRWIWAHGMWCKRGI